MSEQPEYRTFRCCMCPNRSERPQSIACPAGGPQSKPETPCRFVKRYRDSRGWEYFVRSGIGAGTFKAFYKTPDKQSPHGVKVLPWRKSPDEAQADLNAYAQKKGWEPVNENPPMA